MLVSPVRSRRPTPRHAARFLAWAVWDLLATPLGLIKPGHRVAARALREAGRPTRGALLLDLALLRRRRRHRRFRHWLRRHPPELAAGATSIDGARPLLEAAAARGGAIIVTGHGGPQDAASLAFRMLGLDVLELRVARAQPWTPPPRTVPMTRHAGTREGGAWLVAGLRELRSGGLVRLPVDGFSPSRRTRVRVLGVPVPAAGGMASLARLAAVPVFPLSSELHPLGGLCVRFGPALRLPPVEATEASAWEQCFLERAESALDALLAGRELERLARLVKMLRFREFEETLHARETTG